MFSNAYSIGKAARSINSLDFAIQKHISPDPGAYDPKPNSFQSAPKYRFFK